MLGQEETDLSCPENRHNNEECKILSNIEQPILFNPGKESGGGGFEGNFFPSCASIVICRLDKTFLFKECFAVILYQ